MPRRWIALVACLAVVATARAEITYDEGSCQAKASLAIWSYFQKKMGCVIACKRNARSGSVDPAECVPPYPPSKTAGCIAGKAGRANGSICSACSRDKPECYPVEQCTNTTHQFLGLIDIAVDGYVPLVYCDDSGSGDALNRYEAKCMDTVGKYTAKAAYAYAKCFSRCRLNELKGLFPPGTCAVPTSDPYTLACIDKVHTTIAARIDRYCGPPYGDSPECSFLTVGSDWVQNVFVYVDSFGPLTYCEN